MRQPLAGYAFDRGPAPLARRGEGVAFDRTQSRRTYDQDGHMHVADNPISAARVNEYQGRDIPEFEKLNLDPDKIYRLLRDPEELKKAASTFSGKPLVIVHRPQTAADHERRIVIGSIDNARWDDPYLKADLHVWDGDAMQLIDDGSQRELSGGYRYTADMTPGDFKGEKYDGVMRDIAGNHVAIVAEGRVGKDVYVHDSIPVAGPGVASFRLKGSQMPKTLPLSRKAEIVRGALAGLMPGLLAQDQKISLTPIVHGTTAKNYAASKAAIFKRLEKACQGKLAKDANLQDVHGLLDRLDGEGNDETEEQLEYARPRSETGEDAGSPADMICEYLADKGLPDDIMDAVRKLAAPEAGDEEPSEEAMSAMSPADRKAAKDKAARDKASRDKAMSDKAARDKAARDAETEEQKMERAAAEEAAAKEKEAKDKRAMDERLKKDVAAAVKVATDAAREQMRDIATAERDVRKYVGDLDILAQDTAADVYRVALEHLGVKTAGVHPDAFKPILHAMPVPGQRRQQQAHDSGSASADDFKKRYGVDDSRLQMM